MGRIKYYSRYDLASGYKLNRIRDIIINFKSTDSFEEINNINDIIELYNLHKYFKDNIFLKEWTKQDIKEYKKFIKEYYKYIPLYFKSISEDDFIDNYKDAINNKGLDFYEEDFWELVCKFKTYENLTEEYFKEFLFEFNVNLYDLLRNKKIVDHFGKVIKDYMLENIKVSTEVLLKKFEIKSLIEKPSLYLPEELGREEKERIITDYVNSNNPNLNYLHLISNIQSNKDRILLPDKVILSAQRKAKKIEDLTFSKENGLEIELIVEFANLKDDVIKFENNNSKTAVSYDIKWLENNLDSETILNNFIYLFEFVDLQMRCTLISKEADMGIIERTQIKSENGYPISISFRSKDMLSFQQIYFYYNKLNEMGIRLEEVIEWFFEVYLKKYFDICDLKLNMPSFESTLLEKCTAIMPALESALKQFTLFVENNEVDFDLLNISSKSLNYNNLPSLIDKKYCYGNGEEYNTASFLLFSDQAGLNYIESLDVSYKNLCKLVLKEKIKINDFPDYSKPKIEWLLNNDLLKVNKFGHLGFKNNYHIYILKNLYYKRVMSYWNCGNYRNKQLGKKLRSSIDELAEKSYLVFESTLFSEPEAEYFNFFLNKAQFNNGPDIRNKYVHTQPDPDNTEKHRSNYMKVLRLFIITVIKLNDEFCTLDLMNKGYFKE